MVGVVSVQEGVKGGELWRFSLSCLPARR
jgi:hypothetical protein